MCRLRKFLVCLFAALAIAGPIAQVTPVEARASHSHTQNQRFYIYYRACVHSPWQCYGFTMCRVQAQQYANWIRSQGYEAFVR